MKFISKYRRHKFATPVLLLVALSALGFTFSAATAAPNQSAAAASARSTLIEEGKEIFLKGCSSCHGLNAEGAAIAPALIGVGAASVDFVVATGRMPMQDMSQQAMRKAPVYNEEEVAVLLLMLPHLRMDLVLTQMKRLNGKEMAILPKAVSYLEITALCVITLQVKVVRYHKESTHQLLWVLKLGTSMKR